MSVAYQSDLLGLECQFYQSCMAVKDMGVDVRKLRESLVSDLVRCVTDYREAPKAVKTSEVGCQYKMPIKTKDVGCQHKTVKTIKTKDVGCQHKTVKVFKTRDVGCQYNIAKARKTRDASCQHKGIKVVGGTAHVGTNTSFLVTNSVGGKKDEVPLYLSAEVLQDAIVEQKCIRPSPDSHLSQTTAPRRVVSPVLHEEVLMVSSNSQVSPEIPRQDSVVYASSSRSPQIFSKTKSAALEQNRLSGNEELDNQPPSSSDDKDSFSDLQNSNRKRRRQLGDSARVRPAIKKTRSFVKSEEEISGIKQSAQDNSTVIVNTSSTSLPLMESRKLSKSRRKKVSQPSMKNDEPVKQFTDPDGTNSKKATTRRSRDECSSQEQLLPVAGESLFVSSNCEVSPEIPRQDSVNFIQASTSRAAQRFVKRKSLRLTLKRLENSEIPHSSTPDNVPLSADSEHIHKDQHESTILVKNAKTAATMSGRRLRTKDKMEQSKTAATMSGRRLKTKEKMEQSKTAATMSGRRLRTKDKMEQSKTAATMSARRLRTKDKMEQSKTAATISGRRLRTIDKMEQSLPVKTTIDTRVSRSFSLANTTMKLDTTSQPIWSPLKKRKKLLGNRKLEAFKLSVVDDKEYTERNSTIRMDTSVLVAPRLR